MIKSRVSFLLFCGAVFFSLSGCVHVVDRAYNALRETNERELTMKIIDSTCSDLKGISISNGSFSTDEFMRLTRVYRLDTTKSDGKCQVQCTGGERLSSENRLEICNQKIAAEVEKQRAEEEKKAAEFAQRAAIEKAKTDKVYSDLVAKGYKEMSFEDFQLDANSLPNGKKVYVKGYYEASGNIQYLVRSSTIGNPQQFIIPLITDNANREARKILIRAQGNCIAGRGICPITAIGRVTRCEISFLLVSRTKTCISLDSFLY